MGLADITPKGTKKNEKDLLYAGGLKTNLDLIHQNVMEKKAVNLITLSAQFHVSLKLVEEWARVLDRQGLLELYYPVVGGAQLRVKGYKKKPEKVKVPEPANKKKRFLLFQLVVVIIVAIIIVLLRSYNYI